MELSFKCEPRSDKGEGTGIQEFWGKLPEELKNVSDGAYYLYLGDCSKLFKC